MYFKKQILQAVCYKFYTKGLLLIKTEKLYYKDSYLKEFTATVIDCAETAEGFGIVLDKTAFYPVGGGQRWDSGTISGAEVTAVTERDGIITHHTKKQINKDTQVCCVVNWLERFYLMQEHTGEHIVSGLIKKLHGLNNIGFHMGSDCVTLDIDGYITANDISIIECLANEAVYRNIPVVSRFFSPAELDLVDFRSKKEFSEDVRIVAIDGFDICACCGTHVKTTGEIGIIKIIDFQKYKKGMRLYMLCGKRAALDYAVKNENIHSISEMLSAKHDEVTTAVKKLLDENAALHRQINAYKFERLAQISNSVPKDSGTICVFEEGLSADELRKLCADISHKAWLAAVFSDCSGIYKYALGSMHIDVRLLTNELNSRFSGKGGGGPKLTGGSIIGNESDIKAFINGYNLQ